MPTKQSKTVKSKGRDSGNQKANIFKLGKYVKRYIYNFQQYSSYHDNLRFAEACLIFLEQKHPDKLKTLKFNPDSTNLSILTGELMNIITSGCLHYIIKNDAQDLLARSETNYELDFLKPFDIDMEFYIMDIKSMWKLDHKTRIGYAHILDQMQGMSNYECDFFNEEFDGETILNGMDPKEISERLDIPLEEVKLMYKRYANAVDKFKNYALMDINLFLNYKPRKKEKKVIWECLNEIYKISLKPFHKFADNCDHYEHGMSSYSDLIIPMIDRSDVFGISYIEDQENNFNNTGVSYPCKVTSVVNGKLKEWHTDNDIKEFYRLCKLLSNLMHLLNI